MVSTKTLVFTARAATNTRIIAKAITQFGRMGDVEHCKIGPFVGYKCADLGLQTECERAVDGDTAQRFQRSQFEQGAGHVQRQQQ